MRRFFPRWLLYLFLVVLYLFHNDLWLWDDPTLVLGLPIGFLYHILFCVAASVLMLLLVTFGFSTSYTEDTMQGTAPDESGGSVSKLGARM